MSEATALRVSMDSRADRIHVGWVVVEICFLIAVLVVFNAFPEWIGVYGSAVEPDTFVPLLAPEFQMHLPWLNIWWGSSLLLAVGKLTNRRWTVALRWADALVHLFGLYVLLRLVRGGPILDPSLGWDLWSDVAGLGWLRRLASDPNLALKIVLGLTMIPTAIGILQRLVAVAKAYAPATR
jgi:hypothetical protein